MVTILEPPRLYQEEVIPSEPAPAQERIPPPALAQETKQLYEWGYSIPCAGVRYYFFRPAQKISPIPSCSCTNDVPAGQIHRRAGHSGIKSQSVAATPAQMRG